jgi:hypothetical protein
VEFGFGAHVAAEGLDGVVVEAGFVERRLDFRFQLLAPASSF